jgi:hypothetical protein
MGLFWSHRMRIFLRTVEEHRIGRLEGKDFLGTGIK